MFDAVIIQDVLVALGFVLCVGVGIIAGLLS